MGAPWLLGCGGMPDIALDGAAAHPVGTTMARASGALVEPALVDLPPKAGQLRWEEDVPMEVLWERRRMIPAADAAHQGKRKRSRSGIAAVPCTSSGCLVRMHHQHTRAAPPRGDGDMARKRKRVTDKPALVPIDLVELQPGYYTATAQVTQHHHRRLQRFSEMH
jgi:hypothetical protein